MVKTKAIIFTIAVALLLSGCKTTAPSLNPSVIALKPSRPVLKPVPESSLIPVEMVENFISVVSYSKELEVYCGLLEGEL